MATNLNIEVGPYGELRLSEITRCCNDYSDMHYDRGGFPQRIPGRFQNISDFPTVKAVYLSRDYSKPNCPECTTVEFSDGTKATVIRHMGEKHDPEKAVLFAIVKKLYGTGEGGFHSVMKNALRLMEGER